VLASCFTALVAGMGCPDGSDKVRCIMDPCVLKHCPDNRICIADYCGGCHARCSCTGDADCAYDEDPLWCRESGDAAAGRACTSFQAVDTRCTPPNSEPLWQALRCAAGLNCTDKYYCRQECTADKQCNDDTHFCGSNDYCRPHSYCGTTDDCLNPLNMWAHIQCVGFASCIDNHCGWTCLSS